MEKYLSDVVLEEHQRYTQWENLLVKCSTFSLLALLLKGQYSFLRYCYSTTLRVRQYIYMHPSTANNKMITLHLNPVWFKETRLLPTAYILHDLLGTFLKTVVDLQELSYSYYNVKERNERAGLMSFFMVHISLSVSFQLLRPLH